MNRPLIMANHGCESSRGRASFSRLVNAVRRESRDVEVHDAFVDVQSPSVAEVLAQTVGPRTVVPLMLSRDQPLESEVLAPARADPDITVSPAIGPDWVLAEIGVQRLFEAGARSDDAIVLAAAAVSTPRAVADIGKAARFLSAVWGGPVHVGLLGGPDTGLADAIDIARAHGHRTHGHRPGRVVVSSYLLQRGAPHDQLLAAGADLVTEPLLDDGAPDPRLVSLVVARGLTRSPESDFAGS